MSICVTVADERALIRCYFSGSGIDGTSLVRMEYVGLATLGAGQSTTETRPWLSTTQRKQPVLISTDGGPCDVAGLGIREHLYVATGRQWRDRNLIGRVCGRLPAGLQSGGKGVARPKPATVLRLETESLTFEAVFGELVLRRSREVWCLGIDGLHFTDDDPPQRDIAALADAHVLLLEDDWAKCLRLRDLVVGQQLRVGRPGQGTYLVRVVARGEY